MWPFKAADKELIGVDIGSAAVRLMALHFARGKPWLSGLGVAPLRAGAVIERHVHDVDAVVDALSRALADVSPLGNQACIAVPAEAAIVKTLSLPAALGDDDIESHFQLDSDKHIPFPFADVAFDFQSLGPCGEALDQQEVLLVACRRQIVEQRVELLRHVGLTPVGVDVDTFAVERAVATLDVVPELSPSACEEGVAVLDIGADASALHVLLRGRSVYRQVIAQGGGALLEQHQERRQGWSGEVGDEDAPADVDPQVLESLLVSLALQVGRALQLYHAAGRRPEVRRMALFGALSALPGVVAGLANNSGLQVTAVSPLGNLDCHPRMARYPRADEAAEMLIASGLALRGRS